MTIPACHTEDVVRLGSRPREVVRQNLLVPNRTYPEKNLILDVQAGEVEVNIERSFAAEPGWPAALWRAIRPRR